MIHFFELMFIPGKSVTLLLNGTHAGGLTCAKNLLKSGGLDEKAFEFTRLLQTYPTYHIEGLSVFCKMRCSKNTD